jgi:hypothetical protein
VSPVSLTTRLVVARIVKETVDTTRLRWLGGKSRVPTGLRVDFLAIKFKVDPAEEADANLLISLRIPKRRPITPTPAAVIGSQRKN